MGLGVAAAAPTGYLDFCQRQPADCGGAPPAVVRKVAEVELARRNDAEARLVLAGFRTTTTAAVSGHNVNWASAFAEARIRREAAEQSNAAIDAAMVQALPLPPTAPALLQINAVSNAPAPQLLRLGEATPAISPRLREEQPKAMVVRSAPPALTPALWGQLTRINDKVNRQIVRRADIQTYGVLDKWATPLAQGDQYGDCEDYVLEKRRALLAAGIPDHAMSIAVGNTSWGESHAVLLVSTDQGDYVLDSLTPWILPWRWAMVSQTPEAALGQTAADETPDDSDAEVRAVVSEPPALEAPLRRLSVEAFNGRPHGVTAPMIAPSEAEPIMTLALASGRPLRGLLH